MKDKMDYSRNDTLNNYILVVVCVMCLTVVIVITSFVEIDAELTCSGVYLINGTFNLNDSDCYGKVHVKAPLIIAQQILEAG